MVSSDAGGKDFIWFQDNSFKLGFHFPVIGLLLRSLIADSIKLHGIFHICDFYVSRIHQLEPYHLSLGPLDSDILIELLLVEESLKLAALFILLSYIMAIYVLLVFHLTSYCLLNFLFIMADNLLIPHNIPYNLLYRAPRSYDTYPR